MDDIAYETTQALFDVYDKDDTSDETSTDDTYAHIKGSIIEIRDRNA